MNYRCISRLSQDLSKVIDQHSNDPEQITIFATEHSPTFFVFSLLSDVLYLLFCVYLMFDKETWTPGVLLLIIAAMESYALYAKVAGTCFLAKDKYYYPTLWWRYATTGASLFILTRLLQMEYLLGKIIQ